MSCAPAIPDHFQKDLEAFNPRLRVRWDAMRDLWVIEERGRTDGNWYYVLFWADKGPRGELRFRKLPETAGPILERLHEIDVSRFARAPRASWKALCEEMDGTRKTLMQARLAQQTDDTKQSAREKWPYYMKGRRSFDLNGTHLPEPPQ